MLNQESVFLSRYLSPDALHQVLTKYSALETIGFSVEGRPIYALRLGEGNTKVMAWSQMHGNESTTTRGLFDFYRHIREDHFYLSCFSFLFIFQLNPDGAHAYTRNNANRVDLNRDAITQTQPETRAFTKLLESFSPHLCLNLHDQRTRFTVGETGHEAAISFLAPAADAQCSITNSRQRAMFLIGQLLDRFTTSVRQKIGRFDEAFNANCYGDYLSKLEIPTILIEAGQWGADYDRVISRRLVYESLLGITEAWVIDAPKVSDKINAYKAIAENTVYGFDEGHYHIATQTLTGVRYKERVEEGQLFFEADEHMVIDEHERHKVCFRRYYSHRNKEE